MQWNETHLNFITACKRNLGNFYTCLSFTLFMGEGVTSLAGGFMKVNKQAVRILLAYFLLCKIFTSRNEVLAKVIFLHLFVILFTGGVWPPDQQTPPGPDPPGTRHPPDQTPLDQTPPVQQTPEYGQCSASTHPTGMHSCFLCLLSQLCI